MRRRQPARPPGQADLFSDLADSSTPTELPSTGAGASASAQSPPETIDPKITAASPGPSSEPPEPHAQPTLKETKDLRETGFALNALLTSLHNLLEILRRLDVKRKEPPPELRPLSSPVRPRGPVRPRERRRRPKRCAAAGSRASHPSPDGSMGAPDSDPEPHSEETSNPRPREEK